MARHPVRGDRWSLSQAHAAAGITRATARSILRSGVLAGGPSSNLTLADVLALKVAATVTSLVFPGEVRPANVLRDPLPREREAVALAASLTAEPASAGAVMLVYPSRVVLARTPAELAALVLAPSGDPFLVLPVGQWLESLTAPAQASA